METNKNEPAKKSEAKPETKKALEQNSTDEAKSTQQPSTDGSNTPANNAIPSNLNVEETLTPAQEALVQKRIDAALLKAQGVVTEEAKKDVIKITEQEEKKAADLKKKEDEAGEAEIASKAYAKRFADSEAIPVLEKTRDNYVPSKSEDGAYHVRVEVKNFDQNKGTRNSVPRIQKYSPAAWRVFEPNAGALGYTVDILHDPTGEYPLAGIAKLESLAKENLI